MLTVFANQLLAQTNTTGIFFQAVARDNFSNPAKERKIYVQSSIIQTTTNGTSLLVEQHQVSTDGTGMFSISIGNGTRVGGAATGLNAIDWSQGPFYLNLKIAITPVAGNIGWDYNKEWVDIGTTSFGAVPYALYSANAGGVNQKLSITDTTKMLAVYAKSQAVQALSTTVDSKLSVKDTLSMLAPYARAAYVLDSGYIQAQLKSKIAIADSGKSYTTPTSLATAISSAVDAGNLIGTTLNANVTGSSLTSVGTLSNLTVTNPIAGSITGNAASATTAASAGTASTATKLAIARNINGVAFDGSGDITITPTVDAGNLTGTTLKSTITTSSLTSLGTLANLTVTNPIAGSITGNAATATIAGNITNTSNSTLTSLPNLSSFGTITSGTISLTTNIKTSGTLTTGAVTYPKVDGSNGQVLTTNGAGVPTWITPTTGGVDLITNQTIGGAKAFSNNIYVQGLQAGLGSGSQSTLFGAATYAGTNGTAIGFMSQNGNSGINNTSVGSNTLRNSGAASNNTVIGAEAGQAMGNGNTIIGASASANNNSAVSNSTAIGAGAIVTASNTIQLGNTSVANVKTNGTLTAGLVTYPSTHGTSGQVLSTTGTGTLTWTTASGPIFKQSRVLYTSGTGTADSQIELGGMAFRYNAETNKIEFIKTTNLEGVWQVYNTSRIESGASQTLQSPLVIYNTSAWTIFFTSTTISGYYKSYEFEMTPYVRGQASDNHSFNIKVLLDGWGYLTLRVIYY
jgi:hypothetical protein